jgi:hypothetical protein
MTSRTIPSQRIPPTATRGCHGEHPYGWAIPLILAVVVGCGDSDNTIPPRYPVRGRVVLSNGKPLNAGRIAFVPKDVRTPPATGSLGRDGSFSLTTKDEGDGAAVGEYKVRIEPASVPGGRREGRRPRFPVKYVDEDSSGLLVTVRAETNQLKPILLK